MKREDVHEGSFHVIGGDFSHAGNASAEMKSILLGLNIESDLVKRAAIATFEAEMNMIIYATAGILSYSVSDGEIRILASDMGPGIEDIELAMQEGYSTAPEWVREMGWGAGMGLPNMKKNSDIFRIESVAGEGTTVEMIIRIDKGSTER